MRGDLVRGWKLLRDLAANGSDADRPWAYSVLGDIADNADVALANARKALTLAPDTPLFTYNLAQVEGSVGHDEQGLQACENTLRSLAGAGADKVTAQSGFIIGLQCRETIAGELGDYAAAVANDQRMLEAPDYES